VELSPFARAAGAARVIEASTSNELIDENDAAARTTAIGLFNLAETYFKSARALNAADVQATHRDEPVNFPLRRCAQTIGW
jgi:hypothetical protein